MKIVDKRMRMELLTFVSWCILSASFGGFLVFEFAIYSFFEHDADGWTWGIFYNLILPQLLLVLMIGSGVIALLSALVEYSDWQEIEKR